MPCRGCIYKKDFLETKEKPTISIIGGETTRGGNGLWAKRLGHGGKTTKGEKYRRNHQGGKCLGGKTSCYHLAETKKHRSPLHSFCTQ